ncbi:MAG TPA: efflux RND transporter periplasmic adaptor subunit, partial [Novosphingobium sp.]|nr:efflux RND transporter periplasmic adaptor subunit [Novosphingobium sp.]
GASALGHWLLHKEPPADQPLPPGVVQLSASQMSGVTIVRAGAGEAAERTEASGQIAADDTLSTPVYLPFSGQVTQVFVQAGDKVAAGQPLLAIRTGDVVDARNALIAAQAQRSAAQAQAKLAAANLARAEQVYKTAGGALKDYQQAQSDALATQSALRSAESALGAARDKLMVFGKSGAEVSRLEAARDPAGLRAETVFRAPVAGVIAQRSVAPGQYVQAGAASPQLTITNPARVWMVAQLGESDAAHVHLGDRLDVLVPALGGRQLQAVVDNVAAQVDPVSHRLAVRATLANADGALKPQMFASFIIHHPEKQAQAGVAVPASAVIHEGDAARVWVLVGPGRLQSRAVAVGGAADGEVRITAGLKAGEQVASTGAIFVNEAGLGQ